MNSEVPVTEQSEKMTGWKMWWKNPWNLFALFAFLLLMLAYVGVVILHPEKEEDDKGRRDEIYSRVMKALVGIVIVGFAFCIGRWLKVKSIFENESQSERKKESPVFSTIFGVVAGLAITKWTVCILSELYQHNRA